MFVLDHLDGIRRSRFRGRFKPSVVLSLIACALLSPAFGSTGAPGPSTVPITHVRILRLSGDVVREGRWAFLISALNHTVAAYGPYVIDAYFSPMSAQREIDEVISGRLINVIASEPGHAELDAAAIPVPIPIDRGLLGYRVALINQGEQAKLDSDPRPPGSSHTQRWPGPGLGRRSHLPRRPAFHSSPPAVTICFFRCWLTTASICSRAA